MTRVKRNNSNPLRILRLYNTDILWQKIKTQNEEKNVRGWGFRPKEKIPENCLKVRDLVLVGTPASCELQHRIPAAVREQLVIPRKKNNNPNAENKTKNQKGKSVGQKCQQRAPDSDSDLSLLKQRRAEPTSKWKMWKKEISSSPVFSENQPRGTSERFSPDLYSSVHSGAFSASLRSKRLTGWLTDHCHSGKCQRRKPWK